MRILVTGARGILGRRVTKLVAERGHQPVTAGREGADHVLDLATGQGLDSGFDNVDSLIHCATDPRRHEAVDAAGSRRLLAVVEAPVVYPGIVGSDVIPLGYYRSKIRAEEAVADHPPGFTIVRATQFHQLIWTTAARLSRMPVMVVPNGTRFQPIDPNSLARVLVEAALTGPAGRLPDVGGKFAYEAKELARSCLSAMGRRRPIVSVNMPGITGAAFRAGGNVTPNRDESGETWNDFIARRIQPR
ncbi:MAG: sugar nucleotide-binding protein [Acidimicrobiia bacterium]|nr:sugar nucleotide-binding protein [Acidimicrobiia bacterium]